MKEKKVGKDGKVGVYIRLEPEIWQKWDDLAYEHYTDKTNYLSILINKQKVKRRKRN